MSASPSGLSNGQTPTPNGGQPQFVRKARAADPLRPRKKPVRRPNPPQKTATPNPNGLMPAARPASQANGVAPQRGPPPAANALNATRPNGGWTNTPTGPYVDFPLFTTKRALREGLRYHIARFAAKKDIDPTDQDSFTRPVTLHRRDPKQPAPGKEVKEEDIPSDLPVDSKERERLEAIKAEKERQRAEDLKQIAPTGNNAAALAAKKNQAFRNEKTTQVHRVDRTEEQKKASDLRYEEALPWHLEDADNKNTWVGNYEAALSDTNVIFVIEGTNFKMVPIEKWYKFTPKGQFKTYTIEEAEAALNKKHKEARWDRRDEENAKLARAVKNSKAKLTGLFTVKSESDTYKNSGKRETQDADDLDFDAEGLFQDDDEQATFEPEQDEDTKDAQEKIKREQLGANVFDQANEADVEKELEEEVQEAEESKKDAKGVKKALKKRERNLMYESDGSGSNPYVSSSEDDTSDEEKLAEMDKKKDEEAKNKAKEKTEKSDSKLPSGASSKGTNTPSGRPKHSDPLKKAKSLKRAGSPNLSESSGNESTRKKKKKHHSSSQPIGGLTPTPGSRQISPAPSASQLGPGQSPRKSSIIKLNVNPSKLSEIHSAPPNPSPVQAGSSMSDGEATGGEMSDGGKENKKIKLRITGGSPTGSRAGSPAPGKAGSPGAGGSRAGSPQAPAPSKSNVSPAPAPRTGPITPQEIRAALPIESINALLKLFPGRVGKNEGQMAQADFVRVVRENCQYGPNKSLLPRD